MFPSESSDSQLRRKNRRGFNLAETLISMLVLTVAIFSVMSVNSYSLRAAQGNRNRQTANMIASTQLALAEALLRVNFYIPSSNINTVRMTSNQNPEFDYVVEDLGFEGPGTNLRGIRCRVFWREQGVNRSYELWTMLYNY